MSAYRVPIVVAALAVIALGAPCKDGAAHGDTCGTVVDVDGIDSGDMSLVQNSMKIREVALHEALKPGETAAPVEAPAEVKDAGEGKAAAPVAGKGKDAEAVTAAPVEGKGAGAEAAAGKEAATVEGKGAGAEAATVESSTAAPAEVPVAVIPGKDNAKVNASDVVWVAPPKASAEAASLSALVLAVICWL